MRGLVGSAAERAAGSAVDATIDDNALDNHHCLYADVHAFSATCPCVGSLRRALDASIVIHSQGSFISPTFPLDYLAAIALSRVVGSWRIAPSSVISSRRRRSTVPVNTSPV
ncbi:hypothetical protein [Paraburkholderia sartisoli]|uniref:Uncharacterized protein n=1 Tax=Paraburkholderia sartisoli TaxID=83784 RepID=A0A1H3YIR0_9BURK|nr:hypothetical protein [Paraburkholderia sartisoli]SEA11091.1 hypothetical protein SAMN05192564_101313 [Paraburkholderia sartisoli]